MTKKNLSFQLKENMGENNHAGRDKHECNFTKQFFLKEISIREKWIIKQNIVVLHSTTLDGPITCKT